MGAGKSTAARDAATALGRRRHRRAARGARWGAGRATYFDARRRGGVPRARRSASSVELARRGRAPHVALGGGAVDLRARRAPRWPATRSSGSTSSSTMAWSARRAAATARWPATAALRRAARRARPALRARWPTRHPRPRARHRAPGAAGAAARPTARRRALGPRGSGEYPVLVGREGAGRGVRWPRARPAASSSPTSTWRRCYAATRPGSAGRHRARRGAQDAAPRRARLARARARRGDRGPTTSSPLGGGVVGDLAGFCAGDLPARHARRAGADDARGPGRLGLRRQDRRRPARGQELRRRLPPAAGRARRPGDCSARCPPPELRGRVRRGGQDRADRRRRAVGARARRRASPTREVVLPARARSCAWSPPTSATAAGARCSTSATPSATRSRRPPATRATATARRSALGLLAALRLSGQDELRDEVAELLAARGLPTGLDGGSTSTRSWRRCAATRSAWAAACRSCWSPRRATSRHGQRGRRRALSRRRGRVGAVMTCATASRSCTGSTSTSSAAATPSTTAR